MVSLKHLPGRISDVVIKRIELNGIDLKQIYKPFLVPRNTHGNKTFVIVAILYTAWIIQLNQLFSALEMYNFRFFWKMFNLP